jgi:predicted Fe-S protein YdhL (DUF1289 family)
LSPTPVARLSAKRFTSMKKRKSPCIDICEFTGPGGWCIGCGRTREECAKWKKMKPFEVKMIERDLKRRMVKIAPPPLKAKKS